MPKNHRNHLLIILIVTFVVRGLYWFVAVDHSNEFYWEYGEIARNLHEGKGYSYFSKDNGTISARYSITSHPQPSAYMLPGYVYYIYPFWGIQDPALRSFLILCGGWLCSLLVVWLLFKWSEKWLDIRIGLFAGWLYALTPEFIVAANTYSATVIIHASILALCLLLHQKRTSYAYLLLILISCSIYTSMRPESIVFIGLLIALAILRKKTHFAIAAFIGMICVLTPWTIRNFEVFDEFLPLTTSSGQNLYRGHNPYSLGVWNDEAIHENINNIPFTSKVELEMNAIFKKEAWRTIQSNPLRELELTFVKGLQLWGINPTDTRSIHPLYYGPWFLILVFTGIGYYRLRRMHISLPTPMILYLLSCTTTSMLFFTLPRYQTMMKVVLLPITAVGIVWIYDSIVTSMNKKIQ